MPLTLPESFPLDASTRSSNVGDKAPQASIIILTYNSRTWLEPLMVSIWRTRGSFEVIVADNDSSDGSAEWVAANHPRARIVRTGGNLGYAAGNNHAAAVARSDILIFLNPDTMVDPDWLVELLEPFQDSTVGASTSRVVLLTKPEVLNACGTEVHISGLTLCRGMGRPRDAFPKLENVAAIMGAAFAIRREVFEAVGGFNENFFMYMEDTALSLEVWLRGWRCVYVPRSIVLHDYVLRFGPRKTLLQERNRYFTLLQVYRWPTLVILLPALVLAEVVTWGFVLARDRKNWKNKFLAYAAVFSQWPALMARRRVNQHSRRTSDRDLIERTGWELDFGQVADDSVARWAAAVFNPAFRLIRAVTLMVVRW